MTRDRRESHAIIYSKKWEVEIQVEIEREEGKTDGQYRSEAYVDSQNVLHSYKNRSFHVFSFPVFFFCFNFSYLR